MLGDFIIYTPVYTTIFWALVLLLSYRQQNKAKFFLGIFMVIAFFLYLSHAVYFKDKKELYLVFDPIYTFVALAVYPIYYWYIKLLTCEDKFDFKNLRMLIPSVLLGSMVTIIYLVMSPDKRMLFVDNVLFGKEKLGGVSVLYRIQVFLHFTVRLIFAIQVVFFLIFGIKLVIRYNKRVINFYSNVESRTIDWVKLLLILFVFTSTMSTVFNFIGKNAFASSVYLLSIPAIIFSFLLFTIGYLGYLQNYTVADLIHDEKVAASQEEKKNNRSVLKEKLVDLFEKEKIYNQPDLKITQLSIELQTNRTYISNLINNEFGCSFSDFVNRYRIDEAKSILQKKDGTNYSLEYVSEVAGFGSIHTFIRVFKTLEGVTPGKYRDRYHMKDN